MPIHKIIQGGENWLPFALSKLRSMKQRLGGWGYGSNQFTMPDGAEVKVRQVGDQQFLRIDGSGPGYEFFATEEADQFGIYTPGAPPIVNSQTGDIYFPLLGSAVRLTGESAAPIYSDALTPMEGGRQWRKSVSPILRFDIGADESIVDSPEFFRTWASWQQGKSKEHVWWPNNGSKSLVTSTQSLSNCVLNQCGWRGLAGPPNAFAAWNDVGLDVPPALYDKRGASVGAPKLEPNVWWRRAAVQEVAHPEFGVRQFFILTDTHGRFHAYPVKQYQKLIPGETDYLQFTNAGFKSATPSLPAWAAVRDTAQQIDKDEFVWTFNKDATKAVTVLMNSVTQRLWSLDGNFETLYGGFSTPDPNSGLYPRYISAFAGTKPMRDDTPGLFEVSIAVTITGAGEDDYDISVTGGVSTFYGTDTINGDQRYYVDAGYLLKNRRFGDADKGTGAQAEAVLGAPEDALLTAEIEVWGTAARIARSTPDEPHQYESGTQDAATARYASAGCKAYYVVREFLTQNELTRILLTNNAGWVADGLGGRFTGAAIGSSDTAINMIQHADLRSLTFEVVKYFRMLNFGGVPGTTEQIAVELYTAGTLAAGPTGLSVVTNNGASNVEKLTDFSFLVPSLAPTPTATESLVKFPHNLLDEDAAKLLMQGAALQLASGILTQGAHVHPDGHWSFGGGIFVDPDGELDIIQMYRGGKAMKRTSHREAFNKAFKQTRGYSFYGTGVVPDTNGGGFQSTGIWVTF